MGNSQKNIEDGRLVSHSIDASQINIFQRVQYSMPFHTMKLTTYECRLKKFVYQKDTILLS